MAFPADAETVRVSYCIHGVAPYMVCGKCQETMRRDRSEARQVEVWERLISIMEKVEAKL